jgi:hypothetical protein
MPSNVTAGYLAAVTLKAVCSVLTVALAVTGYGCGGDSGDSPPVLPSPTVVNEPLPPLPPVPNPNVPGELWSLSTVVVSLEGSACFWPHPVGKKFDWTLSVERNETQVRFVYDVNNPHDNLSFVGTVNEQSFTAASNSYGSSWQCSGGVTFSASVLGRFASDGRTLSGRERFIYRLGGGSELIITSEWNAMRIRESAGR